MAGLVITGASSDAGKTTLTLGILRALRNRGLSVQPFKAGPDYIDPMFHKVAAGVPSYNLDLFMSGDSSVRSLYVKHLAGDTIGVVEGAMGLYDGLGTEKDHYSSAHLSKVIEAPVILILNGSGMSASAAALVLGFKLYDPSVRIAGVIVNQLGSEGHYHLIKEAIERDTGIPCMGWMPKLSNLTLKSRHLGLVPVDELPDLDADLDALAAQVEKTFQLDQLIAIARGSDLPTIPNKSQVQSRQLTGKRIGLFKDKAFNFYYQDNLDYLVEQGAEIIPISPLSDHTLPDCDMLYIGGGYPEVFKAELAANESFMFSLKIALDSGLSAYAECGGMMYLTKAIEGVPMVGFFEDETYMTNKLQRFGYVDLQIGESHKARAHEFHFSDVTQNEDLEYLFKVTKPEKQHRTWKCGRQKKNTIGSYPHIHFAGDMELVKVLFSI